MENRKILALGIVLLFAFSILGVALPVYATVSGSIDLVRPTLVAPGGPIELDCLSGGFSATGGTVYFYYSKNDDPEISDGDVYFASVKTADLDDSVTVFLPSTIDVYDEYYIKATDLKRVEATAVVADDSFEVPETYPEISIDPSSGNVGDYPEISGEDADDYVTAYVFWKTYDSAYTESETIVGGEFTEEDFEIPNAFEGTYKIIVLLEDGDTFATYVEFSVEPAIELTLPATYSIEADELDQYIDVVGTGFPEGTIAEDSITVVVKNFKTGATIETYESLHGEVEVGETDDGYFEIIDLELDALEAGVATLRIPVDGSTKTFEDVFYVSSPTAEADFTAITHYKVSPTEGYIGDDVTFAFINLPALATVDIDFVGETVTHDVVTGELSDDYGALEYTWEDISDLPGETYTVRAFVTIGATTREKNIGTYTVKPSFEVQDGTGDELTEGSVGDEVVLVGNGFPADATISTAYFGTEEVGLTEADTGATGTFEIDLDENGDPLVIPHISGGGKSVTVKVEGEDPDGETVTAETSIIINPILVMAETGDWDPGVLEPDGSWTDYDDADIFPGNPICIVGWGFLAGEAVTVKLYDEDDKLIGSATILSGEKADSDGDLELIAQLPVFKALSGKDNVYLTVAGATSTNKADSEAFDIAAPDDVFAKLFFGLEADGDLDTDVYVGDNVKVIGCGFETKSLTLHEVVTGADLKSVSATNGYFETNLTIPEMEGDPDGEEYELEVEGLATGSVYFYVYPLISITPASGFPGDSFTVKGTGFSDGDDVDIVWVGVAEEEVLDTVDGDDVEDGSFSITLEVPTAVAMAYKIRAEVGGDVWETASFTVLDIFDFQLNKTLNEILAKIAGLNTSELILTISSLKTGVDNALAQAQSAKAAADAAKTAADSAKSTADAAKAAADSAKSAADGAKTAADSAKSSADSAKAAADGLAGLVYAAIGASVIAAIAAIFAVIQLQRKVAG
ncbi:hypothetical protein KEJ47_07895 [Candidatus Bathyarchaeota archaeon]|nr:hypothetical protein [Candidatus Bathyarchaeota archaeon]